MVHTHPDITATNSFVEVQFAGDENDYGELDFDSDTEGDHQEATIFAM